MEDDDIALPSARDSPKNIINILTDDCLQAAEAEVCTRFQNNAKMCFPFRNIRFGCNMSQEKTNEVFFNDADTCKHNAKKLTELKIYIGPLWNVNFNLRVYNTIVALATGMVKVIIFYLPKSPILNDKKRIFSLRCRGLLHLNIGNVSDNWHDNVTI